MPLNTCHCHVRMYVGARDRPRPLAFAVCAGKSRKYIGSMSAGEINVPTYYFGPPKLQEHGDAKTRRCSSGADPAVFALLSCHLTAKENVM
jgi:hypothetical protein